MFSATKLFAHLGDLSETEIGGSSSTDIELREDGSLELRDGP